MQKQSLSNLKQNMENEEWVEVGIEFELFSKLQSNLENINFNRNFISIGENNFYFINSTVQLLKDYLKLRIVNQNWEHLAKAVQIFLVNSQYLLVNGQAVNFKVIQKINTKQISLCFNNIRFF